MDIEGKIDMSHEERDYIGQLHQHGFRVTLQRLIVLDAVCDIGGHATLPAILQRVEELDPTIDQSTIYRALDVLVEAELITRSEIDGTGKVYEIVGNTPHHHLVCKTCGDVQHLKHATIQPMLDQIESENGFHVATDHLIFYGTCAKCLQG